MVNVFAIGEFRPVIVEPAFRCASKDRGGPWGGGPLGQVFEGDTPISVRDRCAVAISAIPGIEPASDCANGISSVKNVLMTTPLCMMSLRVSRQQRAEVVQPPTQEHRSGDEAPNVLAGQSAWRFGQPDQRAAEDQIIGFYDENSGQYQEHGRL